MILRAVSCFRSHSCLPLHSPPFPLPPPCSHSPNPPPPPYFLVSENRQDLATLQQQLKGRKLFSGVPTERDKEWETADAPSSVSAG
jgi:hypothetical protein